MEESWRRKWKVVRKWSVIVWKGILFLFLVSWHHSTLLQTHWASVSLKSCPVWFVLSTFWLLACSYLETQYIIRDALCSENLFVNRNVRDPRRSWTEVWLYCNYNGWQLTAFCRLISSDVQVTVNRDKFL